MKHYIRGPYLPVGDVDFECNIHGYELCEEWGKEIEKRVARIDSDLISWRWSLLWQRLSMSMRLAGFNFKKTMISIPGLQAIVKQASHAEMTAIARKAYADPRYCEACKSSPCKFLNERCQP